MAYPPTKRRHRKRLSLYFGIDKPEKIAFTDDINHDGLFIRSSVTVRPRGTVRVEIERPQGVISLTGVVKWSKPIPQNLLHKLKGGMGVQILSFQAGEELYHDLCDELIEQRGE